MSFCNKTGATQLLNYCAYNNSMKFAFDPDKNAVNLAKHGVSLSEAQYLDWNTLLAKEDNRSDYCEQRMISYAVMGVRLYCVVYRPERVSSNHLFEKGK